jgi:hypothetical protein
VHAAAVQAATSRSQTAALIHAAAPRVEAALKNTVTVQGAAGQTTLTAAGVNPNPVTWLDFRRALIESRLQGLRQRWYQMADTALDATDEDLLEAFPSWLVHTLKAIHEERLPGTPPQSPAETAAALFDRQDFDALRAFLHETFSRAGRRVARMMPIGEFHTITENPGFARGLEVYKRLLEDPIASNHAENEGVFSDALGPLDTYYPLIRMETEEQEARRNTGRSGRAVPYRKPRNIANAFATGHAEAYNPDIEAFAARMRDAFRTNNKAALVQSIVDNGLGRILKRGEAMPDAIEVRGIDYKAVKVETKPDRQIITPGKGSVFVPAQHMMVPAWLEVELRPILDRRNINLYDPKSIIGKITQFTLAGPLDAVIHSANLIGTLVANTPFLGASIAAKGLGNFPFTKRIAAMIHLMATDPSSEDSAEDILEMSKLGLLPERYGGSASAWFPSSRHYAEQTGAELSRGFGPFLYGPRGIDIRARLVMYRTAKAINPNARPQELYLFVNQLGNYTRALQGSVERLLKEGGWSPFYTAGSTMVRNGINAWTGAGPQPKRGAGGRGLRILQAITGGAIGLVAWWLLAHKHYTGKWPWEDPHARFLQIRLNEEDRASKWAIALWGPVANGDAYVDFGFFSPLVKRGARALGITGVIDTKQAGGSFDQMADAALAGAVNAAVHPVFGPPASTAWIGVFGTAPYLTGIRDDRGKPVGRFLPAVEAQPPGAKGWLKQHVAAPLIHMNGLFEDIAGATGLSSGLIPYADEPGNHWLRMIIDLAAPQLFARPGDTLTHAEFLARQRSNAAGVDRLKVMREITLSIRDKDPTKAREISRQALQGGTITADDFRRAVKRATVPKDIAGFRALPIDAAMDILEIATTEEKRRFLPVLAQKIRDQGTRRPPAELKDILERFKALN